MSITSITATNYLKIIARPCIASSSRPNPSRAYATEVKASSTVTTPREPTFGTTVEEKIEKAEIRRYRGPGFPSIPVRLACLLLWFSVFMLLHSRCDMSCACITLICGPEVR